MSQITNCILSWILSDSHTRNILNEFDQNFDEHTEEIKSRFCLSFDRFSMDRVRPCNWLVEDLVQQYNMRREFTMLLRFLPAMTNSVTSLYDLEYLQMLKQHMNAFSEILQFCHSSCANAFMMETYILCQQRNCGSNWIAVMTASKNPMA